MGAGLAKQTVSGKSDARYAGSAGQRSLTVNAPYATPRDFLRYHEPEPSGPGLAYFVALFDLLVR